VEAFSQWVRDEASDEWKRAAVLALEGRNPACWCKEGAPCHGDYLLAWVEDARQPSVSSSGGLAIARAGVGAVWVEDRETLARLRAGLDAVRGALPAALHLSAALDGGRSGIWLAGGSLAGKVSLRDASTAPFGAPVLR
jgi:Domain of unknown function (DUF4326)